MFLGLTVEKLLVCALIAALIVGPDRLPRVAEQAAQIVRKLRGFARAARERLDEETGMEAVDWQQLDPRRYDPRRIIRQALLDDAADPQRTPPSSPTNPARGDGI